MCFIDYLSKWDAGKISMPPLQSLCVNHSSFLLNKNQLLITINTIRKIKTDIDDICLEKCGLEYQAKC